VAHARSVALAAPDVRESLVNEIVGLISNGRYDVSGAQVAPKMIRDHAMDWMDQTS
jgi:anti-sigma28 factor (negative regulator of flagellin synthesis)